LPKSNIGAGTAPYPPLPYDQSSKAISRINLCTELSIANFVYLKRKACLSACETFSPKQSLKKQVQQFNGKELFDFETQKITQKRD
jgi:hypothetical protein